MKNIYRNFLVMVAFLLPLVAYAQGKGNLWGTVKDETGEVLPGAAVMVKGTTLGSATDLNGSYIVQGIPAGTVDIVVNYLGYEPVTREFTITNGGTTTADFVLSQSAIALGDIVISAAVDGQ
ncbi:MAG: carboxypeptidase-like regulatory domain-containing protein [Bacteroides sp.]|nr:carboxypeptidase-like regulatory domain-containing protein [Bacteroides sp.]